jgi:ATP-dependent helicase/nuclease subunit A
LEEVLGEAGIPLYCDTPRNLFETTEILSVLSLLRAVDNPYRDVSLVGAMRCAAFQFTEDELSNLRLRGPGYFYDLVKSAAGEG